MTNGTDNLPVSPGINGLKGNRNSPTVFNSGFWSAQFWDGRAETLEDQAKGPLTNPIEMGMESHAAVVKVIAEIEGYKVMFENAFPDQKEKITIETIAEAIAEYERTLNTLNSPFDKFTNDQADAISPIAKRGYEAFKSNGCTACHSGPHFAGPELAKGQPFLMKFPLIPGSKYDEKYNLLADKGRFEETGAEADKHMWRVPSLRNVDHTAPYFHNGAVESLDEAVRVMGKTQLGKDLSEQDANDIVEFLKTLSGTIPKQTVPQLPQ